MKIWTVNIMATLKWFSKKIGIKTTRWNDAVKQVKEMKEKSEHEVPKHIVEKLVSENIRPTGKNVYPQIKPIREEEILDKPQKQNKVKVREIADETGFPINRILADENGESIYEKMLGITFITDDDYEVWVKGRDVETLQKYSAMKGAETKLYRRMKRKERSAFIHWQASNDVENVEIELIGLKSDKAKYAPTPDDRDYDYYNTNIETKEQDLARIKSSGPDDPPVFPRLSKYREKWISQMKVWNDYKETL